MNSARRRFIAVTTLIVLVVVGLAGVFAAGASAGTLVRPQNVVAPIGVAGGQLVGAHQPVLAGQRRAGAPDYDRMAVGSSVAAETGSTGWSVGDDVYAATRSGNDPAWSTVRSRYWKNVAADAKSAGQWDDANLARMQRGLGVDPV